MKTNLLIGGLLLLTLGLSSTGFAAGKVIRICGSDTMVNLGQEWAMAYSKKTGVNVSVRGGGSGTGIAAIINNSTDICEASRPMKDSEILQAKANGVTPNPIIVAQDGISVVVNPKNSVKKLTMGQLADIFLGKVTNWKDLGGDDAGIVILTRDPSSGTFVFFKEHVLKNVDYAKSAKMLPSNQSIHDEVAQNSHAIGYIGLGYVDEQVRALPIAGKDGKYIEPSVKSVKNKTYPVARPLYWYTNGKPSGEIKKIVDFVLGAEGQKIVRSMDFVDILK